MPDADGKMTRAEFEIEAAKLGWTVTSGGDEQIVIGGKTLTDGLQGKESPLRGVDPYATDDGDRPPPMQLDF